MRTIGVVLFAAAVFVLCAIALNWSVLLIWLLANPRAMPGQPDQPSLPYLTLPIAAILAALAVRVARKRPRPAGR